ncbi:glycosyltransferase family 2 protein [Lachnospiraceae bacterium 48-33]
MKISIITVCLNSENTIERTFKSVLSQTYSEFEYIIVDGKSKDNTIKIIEEYYLKFKNKNISFKWVSEKDKGLYDAMNKGAKMALGEYLIYMNADDEFADRNCLETAVRYMDSKIDVLYGNANIIDGMKKEKRKSKEINSIKKHLPFIPQSAFIRTVIQKKYLFNLYYKISADFDSFLRMYLDVFLNR